MLQTCVNAQVWSTHQFSLICVQSNLHSWKSCECRSAQHFIMKPAPLCCCRSVCSLSPSWRPRCPAASSQPTRPPSSRGSPLWTPDTPTPGTDTRMVVRFTCKIFHILGADHTSHIIKGLITSWKWSFLNMAMLTWLSRPIFTWNFLTPSLVTPSGSKHTDHKSLLHTGGFILKCLKDLWIIHTGSFLPGYSAFHKGLNFSTSTYVKAP